MDLNNVLYFLFMAGLFFVMMRFGCGSHVMGHRHHGASDQDRGPSSTAVNGAASFAPADRTDPVCGMAVDAATAKTSAYQGHVYSFCSQACREKFEAAPATYAKAVVAAGHEGGHRHGCC